MNIDFHLLDDIDKTPDDTNGLDPEESQSAADKLLVLQTKKVELIQQRDSLQARKHELNEAIERLNMTLKDYQKQHKQHETKEKLEYYLHQNDHEYSKLSAPDAAASFVLDNLNVLPSTDWTRRLALVKEFYPFMEISGFESYPEHENGILLTVMRYTVAAKGLPTLKIEVCVRDEAIHRLRVVNWDSVAWSLRKVSSTFFQTLKKNYLRRGKIDLIMYGYHSLARLQHRRVTALSEILQNHADSIVRPAHDASNDPFVSLATLPYIELDLRLKGRNFNIRLYWTLCLNDSITGTVESHLEFVIIGDNAAVIENANDVFLGLISQHGVVMSFEVMLKNIFGIEK